MLHLLLLILKIAGIILAIILGILIVLLCIVLFVPVCYQVSGKTDGTEKGTKVRCKVTWLFSLLELKILYGNKSSVFSARIGWKRIKGGERSDEEKGKTDSQLLQILTPHALDDAGAVCTAMIKLRLKDESLPVDGLIQNYFDFIINKEYRLADGTFARNRPQRNTLWLDDMFMGIPAVAQMSRYDKEAKNKYLAEAV